MKAANVRVKSADEMTGSDRRPILRTMFAPKSVAVIGTSEKSGSVGRALIENLQSFSGSVFPVNPNHPSIFGQETFPTIRAVPDTVDLAVMRPSNCSAIPFN